jgi:hypothetical protein
LGFDGPTLVPLQEIVQRSAGFQRRRSCSCKVGRGLGVPIHSRDPRPRADSETRPIGESCLGKDVSLSDADQCEGRAIVDEKRGAVDCNLQRWHFRRNPMKTGALQ